MLFFQIYWLLSACTNVWNRSKDTLLHCTLFCLLCICMWIFYSQRIPHEMNKQEMERKHTTKKSIDRLDFGRFRLYFSRNFDTKSEKNMNEHVLQQFYGDCYWISTFFIRIEEAIRMDNDRKRIKVRKKANDICLRFIRPLTISSQSIKQMMEKSIFINVSILVCIRPS